MVVRAGLILGLAALLLAGCSQGEDQQAAMETEQVAEADMPPAAEGATTDTTATRERTWSPETFTLSNGMEVIVLPDHRVPVVTHMVWYRVGAADEPVGESGIAHFLEHLMFKGTGDLAPGEFSRVIEANGGVDNAFTSWDYTAYYERVALDRLEMVMRMEADRMRGLNFPDDHFYSERDVVLEETRIREQDIDHIMGVRMSNALWPRHPYGIPIGGWFDETASLTPENVRAFFDTWYAPNNAALVVAGDITAEELRPLAEEIYGSIPAREVQVRERPVNQNWQGPERIDVVHELAGQRELHRHYRAPNIRNAGIDRAAALAIGMSVLDGGTTEWLYRDLVIEQGLATTAGGSYWGTGYDDGRIVLFARPRDGVSFEDLEAGMDATVARFLEEGPTPEQLRRIKNQISASEIYAQDDQASMAQIFGRGWATGRSLEEIMAWREALEAVTAEDVVTALRETLRIENSVTGTLSPAPLNSGEEE